MNYRKQGSEICEAPQINKYFEEANVDEIILQQIQKKEAPGDDLMQI